MGEGTKRFKFFPSALLLLGYERVAFILRSSQAFLKVERLRLNAIYHTTSVISANRHATEQGTEGYCLFSLVITNLKLSESS